MKKNISKLLFSLSLVLSGGFLWGQQASSSAVDQALEQLRTKQSELNLSESDIANYRVTDLYANRRSGISYLYLQQTHQGIPVDRATANAVFTPEGTLVNLNIRYISDVASKAAPNSPVLSAEQALRKAAKHLDAPLPNRISKTSVGTDARQVTRFAPGDWALDTVELRLTYFPVNDTKLALCWEVHWYMPDAQHRWVLMLDANDATVHNQYDLVFHCSFGSPDHAHAETCLGYDTRGFETPLPMRELNEPNSYRVFAPPTESPNHGNHIVVIDGGDPEASPFGWHDTNGQPGAEYTITRGNNVHAYQDSDNSNSSIGDEPEGGPDLVFDYEFEPGTAAAAYRDAAVVNLFYWCNVIHDVWYQYGFDEPAGNFQVNNYGNGGEQGDYIRAEAQDGGGTNNANFSSGVDGSNARIQMYLWTYGAPQSPLTVLQPGSINGFYTAIEATFGVPLPLDPIVETLVLPVDNSGGTLGCQAFTNGAAMLGKVALIDRGTCPFVQKVINAQNAGAVAVIICNDDNEAPFAMGGTNGDIEIPSVMVSKANCETFKTQLANGTAVTVRLVNNTALYKDSSFDNGIIAHEYGHGISIRMTGGPSLSNCLNNAEQMGEGWSDYVGLMLTMQEGDTRNDIRGIGTFPTNQPTDGTGIRPAPYCADFSVNAYTYANSNNANISQPHGVGFIFATALWEMTWDLIDEYGFDPDFYNGSGGNNIAMHLVTEGMKIQPCNPGMIDGRDAILLADEVLYGGANQCIIWRAFARRGFGLSADQGSAFERNDQTEAFDMPLACVPIFEPPTAEFAVSSTVNCSGVFGFTDQSLDIPQEWSWNFGDGNTSAEPNPVHTYTASGTYEVELTVTNSLGTSSTSLQVQVEFPDAPGAPATPAPFCAGETLSLQSSSTEGQVNWYWNGELVFTGNQFESEPILSSGTLTLRTEVLQPEAFVGPADNSFAVGSYNNSSLLNGVKFTTQKPIVLESVWVDAGGDGIRNIGVYNEAGQLLQELEVFIPKGEGRVDLNLVIVAPGSYVLGGGTLNLYRNVGGTSFPYVVEDLVSLTGSFGNASYYYYFYDWAVRELACLSDPVTVPVELLDSPQADFSFQLQQGTTYAFSDASTQASSWFWDFGDGNTSNAQNPTHTYAQPGNYTVVLTVSNGTCAISTAQAIDMLTATSEAMPLREFRLLPNPGNGMLTIEAVLNEAHDVQIRVADVMGRQVHMQQHGSSVTLNEQLNLSHLPSGTYLISLIVDQQVLTRRYVLVR